mmetsp:Transcript_42201/g.88251  ORF Transcript_42201/g.88251 Transcript_42201/m.88251 type:complete len:372 (-) Transcript_42201:460-1575(-)
MGLCTVVVLLSVAHAAAGLRPHFSSHWARRIDHTRILQPQHRVFNGQSADKGTDELNELALGTKMQSNECAAFGPTNGLSMAGDYALRTRTPVLLTESSLAARVDAAVCSIYGAEETRRVREAWARLARGEMVERQLVEGSAMMVQQANSYVEGLRAQPWHDVGKRKWAKKLESKWRIVRDELKAALADESSLLEKGNNVWAGAVDAGAGAAYGADWKTLVLCDRTVWDPVNSQLFPKTCEVLHASKVPLVEAFFAKMPPQTSIAPHSDMCNFVLTYHLGIIVPEGQCDLTVGDEKREWANGRAMLFDTSILHSAENRAPVTSPGTSCVNDAVILVASMGSVAARVGSRNLRSGLKKSSKQAPAVQFIMSG